MSVSILTSWSVVTHTRAGLFHECSGNGIYQDMCYQEANRRCLSPQEGRHSSPHPRQQEDLCVSGTTPFHEYWLHEYWLWWLHSDTLHQLPTHSSSSLLVIDCLDRTLSGFVIDVIMNCTHLTCPVFSFWLVQSLSPESLFLSFRVTKLSITVWLGLSATMEQWEMCHVPLTGD